MAKPRIIIADTDENYISPLQQKFVEELFEKADIEIITEQNIFSELFATPQRAEVLIISEEFYDMSIHRHNIGNIFLMTEQYEEEQTAELNVTRIFKYTSIKKIFNEIIGKSADALDIQAVGRKETQIILVYSASGGVGKTTVAMGISACLTQNYKRVLYMNAARLHSFQYMLENKAPISAADIYARLTRETENIYSDIKHVIRKEAFFYLPPFKAALMSLGVQYSVYEKIIASAKESNDYDFIVIDADVAFDEDKAALLNMADRVVVVTNQTLAAVTATNMLVSNINGIGGDKYIFVCNNFDKEDDNALISPNISLKFAVSEYIEHCRHYGQMKLDDWAKESSIQRTMFLMI